MLASEYMNVNCCYFVKSWAVQCRWSPLSLGILNCKPFINKVNACRFFDFKVMMCSKWWRFEYTLWRNCQFFVTLSSLCQMQTQRMNEVNMWETNFQFLCSNSHCQFQTGSLSKHKRWTTNKMLKTTAIPWMALSPVKKVATEQINLTVWVSIKM